MFLVAATLIQYQRLHMSVSVSLASLRSNRDSEDSPDRGRNGRKKKSLMRKYEDTKTSGSGNLSDDMADKENTTPTATEDYWFFCNRWLARSEDDGKIIRELIASDEQGNPLKHGLKGMTGVSYDCHRISDSTIGEFNLIFQQFH